MYRHQSIHRSALAVSAFLIAGLAGCSDSSSPVVTPPVSTPRVLTGNFVGLAPEGLTYATATQQGTTGPGGSFQYEAGETVTFQLGATALGSAPAASQIDVFDLVGIPTAPLSESAILEAARTLDNTGGFYAAGRIAQVLLTLDSDGDVSNGVQINAEIQARAETIDLRVLGVRTEYLFEDLKRMIRAAANASEVPARVIPTESEALQTAYDTLGISARLLSPGRVVYDYDADGVADEIEAYVFDNSGLLVESAFDSDADGTLESRRVTEYFTPARPSLVEQDINGDGTPDRVTAYTYDAFGELIREEIDFDGQPGLEQIVDVRYDQAGALIFRERQILTAGTSVIQQFSTDNTGNRVEYLLDNEGDGVFDRRDTFIYNEFRDWTTRSIDGNNDGVVDTLLERAFDSRGLQTLATTDNDADGVIDRRTEFVYDMNNRLIRAVYDNDDDPDIEFFIEYTYDSNGLEIQRVTDRTGQNSTVVTTQTTYDSNGLRVRVETDTDGDGQANSITLFDYDANGAPTSERLDREGDGIVDQIKEFSVSAEGVITEERIDIDADGVADAINQFLDLTAVHFAWWD